MLRCLLVISAWSMRIVECLNRLQRAIDYFEESIEGEISLETAAGIACYSRSHFCWLFKAVTGFTPIEYMRERRLSRAASAIVQGEDIAETVYRFGFSGQDVFTRCFKRKFGEPPGQFRQRGGRFGKYTPRLKLRSAGDSMILRYSGRMANYGGSARLRRLLNPDAKRMIARVATEPVRALDLDGELLADLKEASILLEERGLVRLACTVFLEMDIDRSIEASKPYGRKLAAAMMEALPAYGSLSEAMKHFIVDALVGEAAAVFMADEGLAYDWRKVTGAYAKCEVHFDEVCDSFDEAGPYAPNWNAGEGEHYSFIALSDEDVYSYTSFLYGAAVHSEAGRTETFMKQTEAYLTDSFARLILGELESKSLRSAAEAALLFEGDRATAHVIRRENAKPCLDAASQAKTAMIEFIRKNGTGFADFLRSTQVHEMHGVAVEKMSTHFLRYILRSATEELNRNKFFTDELSKRGLVALFYEKSIDFWSQVR